ncbi:hypothetical protein PR202_ga27317 [Eleusine coracana subsp. coracana]|uniref:Phytocyanin domain-containing protein n=1 Tax=Eleusine coracana subsp. coracana TaxID=191504 RepID=A0AAV5DG70_ELECO|nr:hypothetical protein QOZ80_3AG0230980 [Eleusine coracana subsp. coracana]GJN09319.1 hypothetical protein PR202_ga27317 [Eleusine coracana subsp. coracana]
MSALALAVAAVLLVLVDGGACAMYKVGDLDAWGIPPASKPDVYKNWSKSIKFKHGDAIWFLYPPTQDSVLQVTPDAFHTCDLSSTPLLKLDDGNSVFNLTKPGRVYFISGEPKHCLKGQKLWVDVPKADGSLVQPSSDDLAALAPTPGALPAGIESEAPPDGARSADDDAQPSPAFRAVAGVGSIVAAAALSLLL